MSSTIDPLGERPLDHVLEFKVLVVGHVGDVVGVWQGTEMSDQVHFTACIRYSVASLGTDNLDQDECDLNCVVTRSPSGEPILGTTIGGWMILSQLDDVDPDGLVRAAFAREGLPGWDAGSDDPAG